MKYLKLIFLLILSSLAIGLSSCEEELEIIPVDEFSPENVLQTEEGLEALLFSSYRFSTRSAINVREEILVNEITTDLALVRNGAVERALRPFINFNWDPTSATIEDRLWSVSYRAIRDANTLLDNIEQSSVEQSFKDKIMAEARYIRAFEYVYLYKYFGLVPLRTTTDLNVQPKELGLPTEEEFRTFIENELTEASSNLLDPSEQTQSGRATKGHAYATLVKFFMNTRQWDKVIQTSDQVIDLNYYELLPSYRSVFFVENEGNREVIINWGAVNEAGLNNDFQNGAFPPGFTNADNIPEFQWDSSMANWATQFSLKDGFVDSFEANDDRQNAIVQQYINRNGVLRNLRNNANDSRSLKFFDSNQIGNLSGWDFPYIRYADILLSRAEALNEINGPTAEALSLVNQIRERAGLDAYTLVEIGDTNNFKALILQERGWEFFSEGKRREDLIRQEKFIQLALDRGLNAFPEQIHFPYPQAELDANPALKQRDGY